MTIGVKLTIDQQIYGGQVGRHGLVLPAEIVLPADIRWSDMAWSPVDQAVDIAGNGTMIVQQSEYANGRPITLESDTNSGWAQWSTVYALENTLIPGLEMGFSWHAGETYGQVMSVIWQYQTRPSPLLYEPVAYVAPTASGHWYRITLKLQTI